MDAVGAPDAGAAAGGGPVEELLGVDAGDVQVLLFPVALGQVPDHLSAQVHLLAEGVPVLQCGGPLEHIGLQQNELHPGQGMGDFLEHPLVHPAELGSVHAVVFAQLVPHIVDADQNADDVGPQVDAVPLDTGVQIHHPVAGDAPV